MRSGESSKMRNYLVPNIARVIKSRRIRWAGHVGIKEEGRSALKILIGKPPKLWGCLGVDGRTILDWTLKR